ncbi:MAG: hypothetical protein LWX07_11435 [Bacteroidetes bacterium]|nr:hypothetical protein [Bacteroidota bacterium]
MKNFIVILALMLMTASCTKSQDMNWTSLTYEFSAGPLPPPYHYQYSISINHDGSANMMYKLGYDDKDPAYNYSFTVDPEAMRELDNKIKESQLLDAKLEAMPENEHPVGGPLNRVVIYRVNSDPNLDQPPQVFEAPYFPKREYMKGLVGLYDYIDGLVPDDVNSDISAKKTEFESEHKR